MKRGPKTDKGRTFALGEGKTVTLYSIGMLSLKLREARIPRSTQTLRLWLNKGILPQPLFRNPLEKTDNPKSLWTIEQIRLIVSTAQECELRQGRKIEDTDFEELIHERMKVLNQKYL